MEDQEVSSETTDSTPAVEESAPQAESEGAAPQAAAAEKKEESNTPFHEHPRFKELIEERRTYKEQLDQTKGYMEALQREMQALRTAQTPRQANEPKHKQLIEELKAINPAFAEFQQELIQNLEEAKKEASTAKTALSRLDAYEQREFQTQAVSKLQSLMDTNKIPENMRVRYNREVRALAGEEESQGRKLGIQDVERLFKTVHDDYTPFLESIKRDTLKGYVKEKKQDSAPATTTGGAPAVSKAKKLPSLDSAEGMQQAVKWFADQRRAAKKL